MTLRFDELAPWCEFKFDPASGPGGQHVNKTSTRATLLFDVRRCERFSADDRDRICIRLAGRMSSDGRIRVVAQRERAQSANREAATARLVELLEAALHRPASRTPTRPTRASQRRRVHAKRLRSDTKRRRGRVADEG
jgi:ribosome-associated protein